METVKNRKVDERNSGESGGWKRTVLDSCWKRRRIGRWTRGTVVEVDGGREQHWWMVNGNSGEG